MVSYSAETSVNSYQRDLHWTTARLRRPDQHTRDDEHGISWSNGKGRITDAVTR